jgi:hypothetical protein
MARAVSRSGAERRRGLSDPVLVHEVLRELEPVIDLPEHRGSPDAYPGSVGTPSSSFGTSKIDCGSAPALRPSEKRIPTRGAMSSIPRRNGGRGGRGDAGVFSVSGAGVLAAAISENDSKPPPIWNSSGRRGFVIATSRSWKPFGYTRR